MTDTLKERLFNYLYNDCDYDEEEITNLQDALGDYGDDLTGLRPLDKLLITRLLNDDCGGLLDEVEELCPEDFGAYHDKNAFE